MIDPRARRSLSPLQQVGVLFHRLTVAGAAVVVAAIVMAVVAGPGAAWLLGGGGGGERDAVGFTFSGLVWLLRVPTPVLMTVAGVALPIFALARYHNEMMHPGIRLRPQQAAGMMPLSTAYIVVGTEVVALLAVALLVIL